MASYAFGQLHIPGAVRLTRGLYQAAYDPALPVQSPRFLHVDQSSRLEYRIERRTHRSIVYT